MKGTMINNVMMMDCDTGGCCVDEEEKTGMRGQVKVRSVL